MKEYRTDLFNIPYLEKCQNLQSQSPLICYIALISLHVLPFHVFCARKTQVKERLDTGSASFLYLAVHDS